MLFPANRVQQCFCTSVFKIVKQEVTSLSAVTPHCEYLSVRESAMSPANTGSVTVRISFSNTRDESVIFRFFCVASRKAGGPYE